ncbi:hypothetical protein SYNPS1DRAFT_22391 [Syncephalis pseudoplumigaleata]|uniref:Uncharacterized protein n=1 Tax=Syncephalis pseudoplumigaleata TaxID=1712513 RepID=A0A4P9Z000_9FUNG|nr:hypothetical protein SYNPS1DRAFT_22391 [Syncephalis pseudoplumigaleata]|eukprot:RKP25694.1 hypothetical protein SYNPS1DRAFT_22391 [Syncephalis pseudoplumigaleata]
MLNDHCALDASSSAATSARPSYTPAFATRRPNQPFPERKEYLFTHYRDMLSPASQSAAGGMLVLQHNNMTAAELVALRSDLRTAFASNTGAPASSSPAVPMGADPTAVLEVVRVAIMRAALPRQTRLDELRSWLCGPTCVVRLAADTTTAASPDDDATTPMVASPAVIKRVLGVLSKHRKLILLGGRFEQQWFAAEGIRRVSELPDIHTLRAELVGLLSAPAQQLSSLLGRVPGDLARTLEAHQKNLQEKDA